MGIFDSKKIQALEKQIQATEGAISNVILESLLTSTPLNTAGAENIYTTYSAQTNAIYKKYNGRDTLGNWQLRGVVDTRSAFIAGEGPSVICKDDKTSEFLDNFLQFNKMYGSKFFNAVKQAEMEGRELLYLKKDDKNRNIKVLRHRSQYCGGKEYEVIYKDNNDPDSIDSVLIKQKDGKKERLKEEFIYVITGGDGSNTYETTTRAGLVLWEIESYDRTKNAMRKNNHLFGKVTPVFTSENPQDVANFKALAKSKDWKIGDVISALKGNFDLVVPDVGAMENLKAEQVTCAKAISFNTGIPVHWMGYTDLMSNRSTADSLYETINNATILERSVWEEGLYMLCVKAQEIAIDAGYYEGTVNTDFEVKIPLISFSKMREHVMSLSLAYGDGAISLQDYRNRLPGINPYKTQQMTDEDIENALTGLKNERIEDETTEEDSKADE